MQMNTKTLTDVIDYQANKVKKLELPRSGYVTRYDILIHLNVTTDGTSGGTPLEDAIARLIDYLRIQSAGNVTHFAVEDGRMLKYLNIYDLGKVHEDSLPTAAGVTADVYAKYSIYFGLNPTDPFDPSVVLPAIDLSNLELEMKWNDASALGTGYTINSGEIKITEYAIYPDPDESIEDIFPEGIVQPRFEGVEVPLTSIKSDLGYQEDVPTGAIVHRTLIMVTDSSDDRSDSIVSEYGVLFPKAASIPYRIDWKSAVLKDMTDYDLAQAYAGINILDWQDVSGIPLGLDLTEAEKGEVKLGFTNTAQGTIRLMHQMLVP